MIQTPTKIYQFQIVRQQNRKNAKGGEYFHKTLYPTLPPEAGGKGQEHAAYTTYIDLPTTLDHAVQPLPRKTGLRSAVRELEMVKPRQSNYYHPNFTGIIGLRQCHCQPLLYPEIPPGEKRFNRMKMKPNHI